MGEDTSNCAVSPAPLTPKKRSRRVGVYELGKKIGKGSFSTVRKAVNIFTGREVAVKIMKPLSYLERVDIDKEIAILKLLKHPNIIELIDVVDDPSGGVYMIFELVTGGDVFDHLVARGKLKEKEARKMARETISALEYCHAHLVVHRDLKPENLLLDSNGAVKVSDFGLSNIMRPGTRLSTYCGSPIYMAPEILMSEEYGAEVDMWSLGVVLFTLVVGHPPWRLGTENVVEDMDAVVNGNYVIPESAQLSQGCQDFIAKLLVPDRAKRATLGAIKHDPWLNEGYDGPPDNFLPKMEPIEEVDDYILGNLETMGYDMDYAREAILENRACPETIVYHLLLRQFKEQEEADNAEAEKLAQQPVLPSPGMLQRRRTTLHQIDIAPPPPVHLGRRKSVSADQASPDTSLGKVSGGSGTKHSRPGLPQHWNGALRVISESEEEEPEPVPAPSRRLSSSPQGGEQLLTKQASDSDPRLSAIFEGNEPSPPRLKTRRLSLDFSSSPIAEEKADLSADGLRVVKGAFSVDTTTMKPADQVMTEILRSLKHCNIARKRKGYIFSCKATLSKLKQAGGDLNLTEEDAEKCVKFDIEVCRVAGMSELFGVTFHRKSGNVWGYKTACKLLTDTFKL